MAKLDNFEIIKPLLDFSDEDSYYFIQILKRRKDQEDPSSMKKGVVTIRDYFISSLSELERKWPDIKAVCENNNARACIRLNRRSFKKSAYKLLTEVSKKLEHGEYKSIRNIYSNVSGKFPADNSKKWIIDIDNGDISDDAFPFDYNIKDIVTVKMNSLNEFINTMRSSHDENVIIEIPSLNGYHIITRPFDPRELKNKFPKLNIHKDTPTNLYIP